MNARTSRRARAFTTDADLIYAPETSLADAPDGAVYTAPPGTSVLARREGDRFRKKPDRERHAMDTSPCTNQPGTRVFRTPRARSVERCAAVTSGPPDDSSFSLPESPPRPT